LIEAIFNDFVRRIRGATAATSHVGTMSDMHDITT